MVKKLSIVVLNYNGKDLLINCLNSINNALADKSDRNLEVEIVVVDNASTDDSRAYLEQLTVKSYQLKAIFNNRNLGFTGGNNAGIKYALKNKADYVMVLNNDVIVKNPFWLPMVDYLEKNPNVGVIGPKIYFAPGFEFHQDRYSKEEQGRVIWYAGGKIDWQNIYCSHRGVDEVDKGQYDQVDETDFVSGCCLLSSKKVWQKVGLFDDKYFLYYEDSDFSQRVKKSGWQTVYFPRSHIWHLNAGSSESGGDLQDYFITRNRLFFGMRWAPLRSKISLFRESIKHLITGRKWQKIGARDFYLNRFGRGSWK